MLEFILNTSFVLLNPISILAIVAVVVAFSIPHQYFSLYIGSVIASISVFSIPYNAYYFRAGNFDFIGYAMIDSARIILIIGLAIAIIVKIKQRLNAPQNSSGDRSINTFTFILAGCLCAFYFYLFCTDFFEGYQAGFEAYIIITAFIFLALLFGLISKNKRFINYQWLNGIHLLFYSFGFLMTVIMIINSAFASIAYKQTNKIVENSSANNIRYCIQTKGRELNSWLELTPLTIWNKPRNRRSAGTRHAVLVISHIDKQAIYHWSYRLQSWQYNSAEFAPGGALVPDSLDCALKEDYSANIPLIFSRPQTLFLERKQLEIPIEYLPRQVNLSLESEKVISFYALLPNFTALKQIFSKLLLKNVLTTTNVQVMSGDVENINNNWFKSQSELETKVLEDEYGLQKRTIPQVKYQASTKKPYTVTQAVQQHVQYYKREKGIVTTLILCDPYRTSNLNCQHYFIDGDLHYSFQHSDLDLKNWRKLQKALVNRVESWEVKETSF